MTINCFLFETKVHFNTLKYSVTVIFIVSKFKFFSFIISQRILNMPTIGLAERNKLVTLQKREELKNTLGKQYQRKYGPVYTIFLFDLEICRCYF